MSKLATLRPKPGDMVEGVYRVECELGSDPSSIVLGTEVPATGKRYALKYLLGEDGPLIAAALQRFVRVANSAKLFDNPGIVEIYGIGQNGGICYAVTDWLEGTTLERFLSRNGPMPANDAVAMLLPCLEGLAAAHAAGVVHGDLRPASIFLCRSKPYEPERARLYKFSPACWADRPLSVRKQTSTDVEIRQFISPEELHGQRPDARSDVYALGVLLYVMIAGRSPFSSIAIDHLAAEIAAGSFTPLGARVKGVPRAVEAAISQAMATDPNQRFQNAGELLAQLSGERPAGATLAKAGGEPLTYKWIRPASQELSPSLFDLPPVEAEDSESRRERRNSQIVRAAAVLSCVLMLATIAFRWQDRGESVKRPTAKKRPTAGLVQEEMGFRVAEPTPVKDRQPANHNPPPALNSAAERVPNGVKDDLRVPRAPGPVRPSALPLEAPAPHAPRAAADTAPPPPAAPSTDRGPGSRNQSPTNPVPERGARLNTIGTAASGAEENRAALAVEAVPGAVPAVRSREAALDGMRLE